MIRHIFFKELQIALLNRRLVASCLVLVILMVVGGVVFEKRYSSMQNEYIEFMLQERQNIEAPPADKVNQINLLNQMGITSSQDEIDEFLKLKLTDLIFFTHHISKKPSELSFISSHNNSLPNGLEMNYFRISVPQTYSSYNQYFRSFVALDWANIIMYFLSFICLCFAYDAFSGERQNGTLKLMLASSVPRWKIVLAKLFSLWSILLAPIVVGVVVHLFIVQLSASVMLASADYYKIVLFFLAIALFIGVNILLFFAISILTPRASVSSIVCLLVWIVMVFVLPSTNWLIADKLHPVPSISEQNLREELQMEAATDKTLRWSSAWRRNWENHSEDVYRWKDMQDRRENIHREIWDEYRNGLFRQTDASIALSKISPFMIFRWISDRIADNNYYGYRNFHRQAIDYQVEYRNFIIDKDAADPQSLHLIWNDQFKGCLNYISQVAINPSEVPVFTYKSPEVPTLIHDSLVDITIMLLWLGVLFGFVYFAFVRYEVQ